VIDEIAPMEVESGVFVAWLRRALDADRPVVAAVQERTTTGVIGEVKARGDAELLAVGPETRDALPSRLFERVRDQVEAP